MKRGSVPMRFEPARGGSLSVVAARLTAGDTVHVSLEPGDGTRYDLLIVPCWSPGLRDFAYLGDVRYHGLVIVRTDDPSSMRGTVYTRDGYRGALEWPANNNAWSIDVFDWWLNKHLWPRIDAVRGVATELADDPKATLMCMALLRDDLGSDARPIVESWTPEVRRAVEAYCGAVHLAASDHDDVVIPEMPSVLAQFGFHQVRQR